jgi:hypothetical protein
MFPRLKSVRGMKRQTRYIHNNVAFMANKFRAWTQLVTRNHQLWLIDTDPVWGPRENWLRGSTVNYYVL